MELLHSKHHAAYLKGANDTLEKLAAARDAGDFGAIVGLEKTLAFNLAGHGMHTVFWKNRTPPASAAANPDGEPAAAVDEFFGTADNLRAHMTAVSTTIQGSGWGVLAWEPIGQRLIVHQLYDHQANMSMSAVPLLAFDMWEHAFYLQYRNVKADYVKGLWTIVNWATWPTGSPPPAPRAPRSPPERAVVTLRRPPDPRSVIVSDDSNAGAERGPCRCPARGSTRR